jgi:hypothetical protein
MKTLEEFCIILAAIYLSQASFISEPIQRLLEAAMKPYMG